MFGIVDIIKAAIGLLAGLMLAVLYYEGLPIVSHIPYINVIPIVGDIAVGEKQRYATEQVNLATSQMVAKFERDALASQLSKERQDRLSAEVAAANAAIRAADALKGKQAAEDRVEALLKDAEADPELSRPNAKDKAWTPKR